MKRTLLSHFWNEEYLLPWWIKHHREMFEEAVLIDWGSTDRSRKAIAKYAPSSWKVVDTRYKLPLDDDQSFAESLDEEVMSYESKIEGWRMCLNTTEFLIGDIASETSKPHAPSQQLVGCITMYSWKPEGVLDQNLPLWEQEWTGLECRCGNYINERPARSLHNHPVKYSLGRHYGGLPVGAISKKMVILHYANCIASPQMLRRRLKIQERITKRDRISGAGAHHFWFNRGVLLPGDVEGLAISRGSVGKDVRPLIAWLNGSGVPPERNPLCSEEDWNLLHRNISA